MFASLGAAFVGAALALGATLDATWPRDEFKGEPNRFSSEILGQQLWSKQEEILRAVAVPRSRVTVKSGHKVGKSRLAATAALWFYGSFPDARVFVTAPTIRQVEKIVWREVRKLHASSGVCLACRVEAKGNPVRACPHSMRLDGEPAELAKTGLQGTGFREVFGFTAKHPEDAAGSSGANILYVVDESSGVSDAIFEAIDGNRAGGARILMLSNPTKTSGVFFDSHNRHRNLYSAFTISSEESPNVVEGREVIPGLATPEWIEEKREEWGEDSPLFKVRVLGEFALSEDGKIISVGAITDAEDRWFDAPDEGELCIGVDPAGPGLAGDETAIAVRRGLKIPALLAERGLSEDAIVVRVLDVARANRRNREAPARVNVDREGPIGTAVWIKLRTWAEQNPGEIEVSGVRSSDRAQREPNLYDRVRDELHASFVRWIRDGGAIPSDTKLAREMNEPKWIQHVSGRLKVTPKDELRKTLERSPDRFDACMLSVWGRGVSVEEAPSAEPDKLSMRSSDDVDEATDSYDSLKAFGL